MDLKATQEKLLELMVVFDDFCKKHQIRYTLHGGTLLGAVREKGFIPWDDDMDIAMSREEYEKLVKSMDEAPDYCIFGKIKKQFRKRGENNYWIDIFICDYISSKPAEQNRKLLLLTALDVMNRDKNSIKLSDFSKYGAGKRLAFKSMYWFGKLFTSNFKSSLYEKISQQWLLGERKEYVRSNDQYKGRQLVFPVNWLKDYEYIPFGNTELAVSAHYHDLLVSFYGQDYMTPVKDERNSQVHDMVRSEENISL